jgi:hypothetical protein
MGVTLATRKPIDELTESDIVAFPIWEFCSDEEDVDGQDETWVRPVDASVVELGLYSLSVAADFVTADGRSLVGIIGVTTADDIEIDSAGALMIAGQYLYVAPGDQPFALEARERVAKALDADISRVFPIEFQLRVLIEGESLPRMSRII